MLDYYARAIARGCHVLDHVIAEEAFNMHTSVTWRAILAEALVPRIKRVPARVQAKPSSLHSRLSRAGLSAKDLHSAFRTYLWLVIMAEVRCRPTSAFMALHWSSPQAAGRHARQQYGLTPGRLRQRFTPAEWLEQRVIPMLRAEGWRAFYLPRDVPGPRPKQEAA